jgi:RNA polymerase sigma-70 factor (ECF subfamily)
LEQVAVATPAEHRSEAEILYLERLRAGDTAAFEELVNFRSSEIYSLLYRLTESVEEAQDLTQETFLKAFQNIARFRGDSDIKTWLYRIALNEARNRWRWWRRRRRDLTISIETKLGDGNQTLGSMLMADIARNPERETIAKERESLLRKALRSLSSNQREVVILRDMEGLSYDEIASALEISIGTVKSRIARGREELKKRLERNI